MLSFRKTACLFALLTLAAASPASADQFHPTDLELMQGTWTIEHMETGGESAPARDLAGAFMTIDGDRLLLQCLGGDSVRCTISLNPSRSPKGINLVGDAGKYMPGIYEIEGDDMLLCLSFEMDRPRTFLTASGDNNTLFHLRRHSNPALPEWVRLHPDGLGCSFEMPSFPDEQKQSLGGFEMTMFVTEPDAEGLAYMMQVTHLPLVVGEHEVDLFLDSTCAFVTNGASDVTIIDFETAEYRGRELIMTTEIQGHRFISRTRVFVIGDRAYTMLALGSREALESDSVERFWNSFELAD